MHDISDELGLHLLLVHKHTTCGGDSVSMSLTYRYKDSVFI